MRMDRTAEPTTPAAPRAGSVFPASGEMGRRCREMDWAATPLGPVEGWPQSLCTAAGMVLASAFPSIVLWGPELIQIYNDGYIPVHGAKHPLGLGQPTREVWPEVWHINEPLFERALRGETVALKDAPYSLARRGPDHPPDSVYVDLSFSPIPDESGDVGGVLVTLVDTTMEVAHRELQAEQARLLQELDLERERLAFVFEQAPAFLAVLRGPQHTFELANPAYYGLVGHRELVGKPVREALPEVEGQGFVELLDGVLETGEPFVGREVPAVLARTPGAPPEERFIDLTYMPLVEADGTRSGVIAHGTDVTGSVLSRREVERLLRESEVSRADAENARAAAEAANRAKADFLAAMSHELRTPLNAISGYVDVLDAGVYGPLTEAQRRALMRVAANQRHLLALIDDVLSFAKLEAGRIEFDLRPLDARALLAGVKPLVASLAKAKGIALRVEHDRRPLQVLADRERATQVLLNLVGNAIKFTPEGGSVVLSSAAADRWVDFHVRDDGPGIDRDKQDRIFEAFMQVDRRLSTPQDGVGLGLAISRDLARGMGGELSVESAPGEGSTFTVRLPAAEAP
jgi:signal transduction histidine kinase